jgi:hypothetical protein
VEFVAGLIIIVQAAALVVRRISGSDPPRGSTALPIMKDAAARRTGRSLDSRKVGRAHLSFRASKLVGTATLRELDVDAVLDLVRPLGRNHPACVSTGDGPACVGNRRPMRI